MKKGLLSVALAGLLFASCGTTSRTTTSDNAAYYVTVPQNIRTSFSIAYPDASNVAWNRYDAVTVPIDWEMAGWTVLDPSDYVVTFDQGKSKYYAWYDSDGTLVGTATAITDNTNLPGAVNSLLQKNFSDYEIVSIEKEMKNSQTAYEIKLKKTDDDKIKLLVDSDGKILKQKNKD